MSSHISKLYLFSKDTDAPDVIKGFKYQELKTLEVWLFNKVNSIDEHIYCDYEEDIFQRNLQDFKSTFKQLKLYSSKNFSFSSIEIKKTIAHFFMLFVKDEYLLDDPLFIFETNTSIAESRGNNDADLLRVWAENQEALSDELLTKCIIKLKSIIDVYVSEQHSSLTKDGNTQEPDIALEVYNTLPQETWEHFAKSIRWIFKGISSEKAIEVSISNSLELISHLPFPLTQDDFSKVFDRLRGLVGDKSMADDPEDRLLTNELLDHELLNLSDKDDSVYSQSFELWKNVQEIKNFTIGEFYQILFAAKHCRRNSYLKHHTPIWLNLLNQYALCPDILIKVRREAIYEIVWLTFRPPFVQAPISRIEDIEKLISNYFSDFQEYEDIASIEDTFNLLSVTIVCQASKLIDLDEVQVTEWQKQFDEFIIACKAKAPDKNAYCNLLEIEGFSTLKKSLKQNSKVSINKALGVFEEIIRELPNAPFYPVSHLGQRIDKVLDISVQYGIEEETDALEEFSEKLLPFVQSREGNFSAAKRYTEKGIKHLESSNPKGLLKALDYLHKAKVLYQDQATNEGFILALINISQLYSSIGMNLAAKYYSLIGIWFCSNTEDPKLYKRISDFYALLTHIDFKQGAWFNALLDFEEYIFFRNELDPAEFNPEIDELLRNTLLEVSFIMAILPSFSTPLKQFIDGEKLRMDDFYNEFLEGIVNYIEEEQKKVVLTDLVANKLDNPPVNDIGSIRTISWKALDSVWHIEFTNDYITNSVGEEFASLFQIIQADLALSGFDFFFIRNSIRIKINVVDKPKAPVQLPSPSEYIWDIFIPVLESKEPDDKKIHYAALTISIREILNCISLLPENKFLEEFDSQLKKGLLDKTLIVNTYQKVYKDAFDEEKFNISNRSYFSPELIEFDNKQFEALALKNDLSNTYDNSQTLKNIEGRFKNCLKVIHLTLKRLVKDREFNDQVDQFKKEGWLDWQIVLALYDELVTLKANNLLRQNGKSYSNENDRFDDYEKLVHIVREKDECETYVEIPLNEIIGKRLLFHMQQVPILVLLSYGLENKSRFPVTSAIRDLLIKRFKFSEDEVKEYLPFRN